MPAPLSGKGLDLRVEGTARLPLDLALTVAPGEILALVGRSGAGKSSLLSALAGHLGISRGHVRVDGECWFSSDEAVDLPPHRRRCGMMFQSYALFPHMTAVGNILAAMGHEPEAARPALAEALLHRVHLQGLGERSPHQLSGGQQQRVALARALARAPRLLLLDEPFSAVDRPTRRALVSTIQELRADLAIPVIVVSHDIEDVARIADRIAVLEGGRILQQGPTTQVIAAPASPLVADLVA